VDLSTVWFIAIAVLWIAFLLLEGFDFGVGMHLLVRARSEEERRVMLNTIGPVWDGNEVWLLTAGAATFAAFPLWYASLFSVLYIPLTLVLLGLIFRAVAIEYRGKGKGRLAAFGLGAGLALTTTGLPIDANGDRVGGPFVWLTPVAVVGGLALVGFAFVHGANFLALKSDGVVRERAGRDVVRTAPFALLPLVGWVLLVQVQSGDVASWVLVVVAVVAVVLGYIAALRRQEGRAFLGFATFLIAGAASIFAAVYPVVLPSTVDAAFNLTVDNAASGDYTLGVMTVVTAIALPVVIGYQAWSYWVFRRRVSVHHIPPVHDVVPAIRP
jgi:cytochrome d ubiquinol oxidase subunit II